MTNPVFDAGIFITLIVVGFSCLTLYQKIGGLLLVVSILSFLVTGLLILTGYDVSSYTQTITSSGSINETSYFIGNGDFPITGTGQLLFGYCFILLSLVVGILFLVSVLNGNLIKG